MMTAVIGFLILVIIGKAQEIILPQAVAEAIKPAFLGLLVGILGQLLFARSTGPGFRLMRRPFVYWVLFSVGILLSLPMSLYFSQSLELLVPRYLSIAILFFLVARNLGDLQSLESTSVMLVVMMLILGGAMVVAPSTLPMDLDTMIPRKTVSVTYDPNDLAVVLVMGMPFLMYWFWRGGLFTKGIVVVAAALALYAIKETGSRGGLLSLGVVILYMIFRVPEVGGVFRTVLVLFSLLGAAAATQTSTFSSLLDALRGEEYNSQSEDGRLAIWTRGIGYAFSYPLTGVGVGCFETADGTLSGRSQARGVGIRWAAAHNSIVQVLAEIGFAATFCWLAMIFTAITDIGRLQKRLIPWQENESVHRLLVFAGMTRCSLFAYLVGGFFLSLGYFPLLYLMVGYSIALSNAGEELLVEFEHSQDSEDVSPDVPGPPYPRAPG